AAALTGSLLCLLYADSFDLGAPSSRSLGLWGYNGVLTSIALSGVVLAPVNLKSLALHLLGLLMTMVIQASTASVLPVPCGTMPFCLAVAFVSGCRGSLERSGVCLWGYNGILTSIALSGVVLAPVNLKSLTLHLLGLLMTAVTQASMASVLSIPCGTMPFCLAVAFVSGCRGSLEKSGLGSQLIASLS
ncbi:hypothetical protein TrRE_jg98, partial [Triparma retinervis]